MTDVRDGIPRRASSTTDFVTGSGWYPTARLSGGSPCANTQLTPEATQGATPTGSSRARVVADLSTTGSGHHVSDRLKGTC